MKILNSMLLFSLIVAAPHTVFSADKVVVIPLGTKTRESSPEKIWGQARPNTTTLLHDNGTLTGGSCTSPTGVKFALSKHAATWNGAGAVCPKDAWVCTSEEIQDTSCPISIPWTYYGIGCDGEYLPVSPATISDVWGWVADAHSSQPFYGHVRFSDSAIYGNANTCITIRVWCCMQ